METTMTKPVGRPKIDEDKKYHTLTITVLKDQREYLERKAKQDRVNRTLSAYLRNMIEQEMAAEQKKK